MKTFSTAPGPERARDIPCPVCGSFRRRPFRDCGTFSFQRCRDCGHAHQNPQPVFEDLRERYRGEYFSYERENEDNFFRLMLLGFQDIRFPLWEGRAREMGAFLDIGCATGRLLEHFQSRGWRVQGVEICEDSARYGIRTRGVPIFIGPLEEADFGEGSFSLIHLSHLIEHVPDPAGLLDRVYRLLVPGGTAVIVTPNRGGLQARLLREKWRSCIADHLHLFHRRGLSRLVRASGFRILEVHTWGGLARGLAPSWLKKPLDDGAKIFGFGDVMLFWVKK